MNLLTALLLTISIISAILVPSVALAQQTGDEPYHVDAGPYQIDVVANPSRLALGTVQYLIEVYDSQDRRPVSDARVLVRARYAEGGEEGWANALNAPNSPARYTARIELDRPGVWDMSVEVSSSLGRVEVEVPSQTVSEPRPSPAGGLVFLGVFVVLVLGGSYLAWTVRRTQRKRETTDAG